MKYPFSTSISSSEQCAPQKLKTKQSLLEQSDGTLDRILIVKKLDLKKTHAKTFCTIHASAFAVVLIAVYRD